MDKAYAAVLDTVTEKCVTVSNTAVAAGVAAVVASFNRDDVVRQYVAYTDDNNKLVIVGVNEL